MLDEKRIAGIAEGCRQVAALPDPIGEVLWMRKTPNGLNIGQKRVPMGVIGIIYEARPNVTVDAAALCFKAGSACILRGGKEAFHSSMCLTRLMRAALAGEGLPEDAINLVEDTSRDSATQMMKLNGWLDVLIPRGGAGLIQSVVRNATVPVIETGTGNCHVYVDASADLEDLAEAMGLELPEDELEELDCDTVGGLVFALLPVIPEDGSRPVVEAMGLRIRVEELWDRRVEWALAEKAVPADGEND